MESSPLVSVCSISYNNSKYVIQALESVLSQGYPNIELVVVDDLSTDDSVYLIEKWLSSAKCDYQFIKHHKNRGVHHGFNETIDIAKGKYIGWVSDDLWVAGKLKKQVEILESLGDEYALTYGDASNIDAQNNVTVPSRFKLLGGENHTICQGNVFENVISGFGFLTQSCLFRIEAIRKSGYRADKRIISEDTDLLLYLSKDYKFHGTTEVMSLYRTFENSNSVSGYYWREENKHHVYLSNFRMYKKHLLKLDFFSPNKRYWFLLLNKVLGNGQNYLSHPYANKWEKVRVFLIMYFLKAIDKVFR